MTLYHSLSKKPNPTRCCHLQSAQDTHKESQGTMRGFVFQINKIIFLQWLVFAGSSNDVSFHGITYRLLWWCNLAVFLPNQKNPHSLFFFTNVSLMPFPATAVACNLLVSVCASISISSSHVHSVSLISNYFHRAAERVEMEKTSQGFWRVL